MAHKRYHNIDATAQVKRYVKSPGVFHLLGRQPTSAALYLLTTPPAAPLFLTYSPKISFSNLEVYSIRLGAVDGMVTGYLFNSPLVLRHDYYFLVFHRKRCDPVRDIVQADVKTTKRFVFDNVNLGSNDFGYILTLKNTENAFTRFVSQA
jgi:hypothetical protein